MRVGVIGGGIIGASCAVALADRGADVLLIEKGRTLFGGSTSAGFGSLTPFSDPFFTGQARAFAARSVALYRNGWIPRASAAVGSPVAVGDRGLLDLIASNEDEIKVKQLQAELEAAGYVSRLLERREVLDLEPQLQGAYSGALWLDEPWMDFQHYLKGLECIVQRHQRIRLVLGRTAEHVCSDGVAVSVALEGAGTEAVDVVLIATGVDGTESLVPEMPKMRWIRGDALEVRTESGLPLLERHVYKGRAFMTPRNDGRVLLGATYHEEAAEPAALRRVDRQSISVAAALGVLRDNCELVPALSSCDITRMWRGWRPALPDNRPVLGFVRTDKIAIANGFIGLGLTMAPAVAEAICGLVLGGASGIPAEFDPQRFVNA